MLLKHDRRAKYALNPSEHLRLKTAMFAWTYNWASVLVEIRFSIKKKSKKLYIVAASNTFYAAGECEICAFRTLIASRWGQLYVEPTNIQ